MYGAESINNIPVSHYKSKAKNNMQKLYITTDETGWLNGSTLTKLQVVNIENEPFVHILKKYIGLYTSLTETEMRYWKRIDATSRS